MLIVVTSVRTCRGALILAGWGLGSLDPLPLESLDSLSLEPLESLTLRLFGGCDATTSVSCGASALDSAVVGAVEAEATD